MELTRLNGVGSKTAQVLTDAGYSRIEDLLTIVPRGYVDRTKITSIAAIHEGALCHVIGVVRSARASRGWGRRPAFGKIEVADETGSVTAHFFGVTAKGLTASFREGRRVLLSGVVRMHKGELVLSHPDALFLDEPDESFEKFIPIYSEIPGVSAKRLRAWILQSIDLLAERLIDALPRDELRLDMPTLVEALRAIHAPPDDADPNDLERRNTPAYQRLIFDELFFLQLGLLLRRQSNVEGKAVALGRDDELAEKVLREVGYELTTDQRDSLSAILRDLSSVRPMHRLLMGDVGSGKTIVAILAAARVIESGYQAAIMVPTEVLARQHFEKWSPLFERLGIGAGLFLGDRRSPTVRVSLDRLGENSIQLAFGTHALLGRKTRFDRLALVVIDEQHRFGVGQRARLSDKTLTPHVLVMSATPIPRSLAHTVFGDLDLSVIKTRPPGRKGCRTEWIENDRDRAYQMALPFLERGERVFVIFPLVEGSEDIDAGDAVGFFQNEAAQRFCGHTIGLLHGRMTSTAKDAALRDFAEGRTQILVCTTVVEVGIDVAEAGVVIIEDAQRFGLSSLHQIRGRVGRSDRPGLCLLVTSGTVGETARRRLLTLVNTDDGFQIAEEDLAIRGPGDMLGFRQHGLPRLRFACLARDVEILENAREAARKWWDRRGHLRADPAVERILRHRFGEQLESGSIG